MVFAPPPKTEKLELLLVEGLNDGEVFPKTLVDPADDPALLAPKPFPDAPELPKMFDVCPNPV